MRSFEESAKSKKTVASMIEKKGEVKEKKIGNLKNLKLISFKKGFLNNKNHYMPFTVKKEVSKSESAPSSPKFNSLQNGEELTEEMRMANLSKLASKFNNKKSKEKTKSPKPSKEGKKPRVWDLSGTAKDMVDLDRTKDKPSEELHFNPDRGVRTRTI